VLEPSTVRSMTGGIKIAIQKGSSFKIVRIE
jgi:hypothetical protein